MWPLTASKHTVHLLSVHCLGSTLASHQLQPTHESLPPQQPITAQPAAAWHCGIASGKHCHVLWENNTSPELQQSLVVFHNVIRPQELTFWQWHSSCELSEADPEGLLTHLVVSYHIRNYVSYYIVFWLACTFFKRPRGLWFWWNLSCISMTVIAVQWQG